MTKQEPSVKDMNVKTLMDTSYGQEFVWDLLAECGIYDNVQSSDPAFTNVMIGKRAIGLYVLQVLEDADPTIYPKLILSKQNG